MAITPQLFNTKPDKRVRRQSPRQATSVPPNGAVIGDLWYEVDAQTLWVFNGTTWLKVTGGGVSFSGGNITATGNISAGGTVYANQFKVSPNDTDDAKIDLYDGSYLIGIRDNTMYFKSGGSRFDFETPPGSWAFRYGGYVNGTERGLRVEGNLQSAGETYTSGWFRNLTAGNGYYFQGPGTGGGWHMNGSDAWLRAYGDKPIYSAAAIRSSTAEIHHWRRDGGYAAFGHYRWNEGTDASAGKGYAPGYMHHDNGHALISISNNLRVRHDTGWGDKTMFRLNLSSHNGGENQNDPNHYMQGVVDLAFPPPMNLCGTVAHFGGDTGWGLRQLGACSSSIRWKEDVSDLRESVSGINNPMFKFRPVQFKWREDIGMGNAKDVNCWRPEGTVGVIAEEVMEIAPDAVSRELDGAATAPDIYVFLGYLIDAVQYLKRELDELKNSKEGMN